jgi:hypothetical protein
MKYFFILAAMLVIHFSLIRSDREVISSAAMNKHALVVSAETVKDIKLDAREMKAYAENLMEYSGETLDTAMFAQIISNARAVDRKAWHDEELRHVLVVRSRDEDISRAYLIEKMNLSGKKQMRYYTRQINRYNDTEPSDRNIFCFSKPVYDNSGKYAIVQWDNGRRGSAGEGGIDLYHLEGSEWAIVGVISSWKH